MAAGATSVPRYEFRMTGGVGELGRPFVDTHSEAWGLPTRRIHARANHSWEGGMRVGPRVGGAATNRVQFPASTPPALQRASVRELTAFLQPHGQMGSLPTMNTDMKSGL